MINRLGCRMPHERSRCAPGSHLVTDATHTATVAATVRDGPVASPVHWRIRLVAYGARLESGLG